MTVVSSTEIAGERARFAWYKRALSRACWMTRDVLGSTPSSCETSLVHNARFAQLECRLSDVRKKNVVPASGLAIPSWLC